MLCYSSASQRLAFTLMAPKLKPQRLHQIADTGSEHLAKSVRTMSTNSSIEDDFSIYADYLNNLNVKQERVEEVSHDIAMNSIEVILQVHRLSKDNEEEVLEKAGKDSEAVRQQDFSRLLKELQGTDFCKLRRAYSPGVPGYEKGNFIGPTMLSGVTPYMECYKVLRKETFGAPAWNVNFVRSSWFHSTPSGDCANKSDNISSQDGVVSTKCKRKKLKGKRMVVRWLKFFRWKKKKEYERMSVEERILNKLTKARRKEEHLLETMKKLEPTESSETTHDPEILTPEEHFYYLKIGLKCKNYVPVGRRGIYQGVILNMHLHWKKHQTLQVVIKTFTPEEVKEIAVELARLTGGIVLDIHEGNTVIMYRGKNYVQPPTEIMSPRITLPRKKALDKSKCRDALRAVRKYIPRLQQELQLLQAQAGTKQECSIDTEETSLDRRSEELKNIIERSENCLEDEQEEATDSELSYIFESDSESENEKAERPLFLEEFEKFPALNNGEHAEDIDPVKESPDFDEVDKIFLRAAKLLKKKRR